MHRQSAGISRNRPINTPKSHHNIRQRPSRHTSPRSIPSLSQKNLGQSSRLYLQTQRSLSYSSPNSDSFDSSPSGETHPPKPPRKYNYVIPPRPYKPPGPAITFRDRAKRVLDGLAGSKPDYCSFLNFESKDSLLGWKIVTDSDMNGSSVAEVAWGRATCPVTGNAIRTLVFQGSLGTIILPKDTINHNSGSNASGVFNSLRESLRSSKTAAERLRDDVIAPVQPQDNDNDDDDYDSDTEEGRDRKRRKELLSEYGEMQGFVGLISPQFNPPIDISNWDTFNICVRTDGGPWMASMKPHTPLQPELYLGAVPSSDGTILNPRRVTGMSRADMRNLFVPIEGMTLARSGRYQTDIKPHNNYPIKSFGVSIRGPPGPFKIEIGWVALAKSSLSAPLQEERSVTPKKYITMALPENTLEHTANLDAEQLYKLAQGYKTRSEIIAKELAVDVQDMSQSPIDTTTVLTLEEIQRGEYFPYQRQGGDSIVEYGDVTPYDLSQPGAQVHLKFPTKVPQEQSRDVIDKMFGWVYDNKDEPVVDLSTDLLPAEYEEELYKMQKRASLLTQSDMPLIVPSYDTSRVMAQARLDAVNKGYMDRNKLDSELMMHFTPHAEYNRRLRQELFPEEEAELEKRRVLYEEQNRVYPKSQEHLAHVNCPDTVVTAVPSYLPRLEEDGSKTYVDYNVGDDSEAESPYDNLSKKA